MYPNPSLEIERDQRPRDPEPAVDGLGGGPEGREEPVPCAVDLAAFTAIEQRSHAGMMTTQKIAPPPVPYLTCSLRGTDEIREEERSEDPGSVHPCHGHRSQPLFEVHAGPSLPPRACEAR